jgi:hypothetical protein
LVWAILSAKRREKLIEDAARARRHGLAVKVAWAAVLFYNCVGLADVFSTWIGIERGLAEEINPLMKAAMDNFGLGWIGAKLTLQLLISYMVLWFPHRIVLAIFIAAASFNAWIVYRNFMIAGFF